MAKELAMSATRIESMVTITGSEYVAMQAEIERLRAALKQIVNVKPYYGAEADYMLNIARAALEGPQDRMAKPLEGK